MEPKGQIFVWRDIARHTSAALPQLCLCLVQRIWVCSEKGYSMYFRWLIIIFLIFPIKTWSELRVHLPFSDNKAARLQSCLRIQCQAHQKTGSSADKAWVILFIPHCNVTEMMVGIGFNYPQWNPQWPNCSICFKMCTWIWAAIVRTEHSAGISWRLNRYYYMSGMFQQKCSRDQVVHPYMNHVWNMCQDLAPKWQICQHYRASEFNIYIYIQYIYI